MSSSSRDQRIVRAFVGWFERAARELPWRRIDPRTGGRDPYRSLVSELMLQQTQVARVVGKFNEFVERFPTAAALAKADEREVLAAWAGLGYYRRARLLHAAAKELVSRHGGEMPRDPAAIRALPGVGRYTAGAVASMVFGLPEPLVDGNVIRVLSRLDGRTGAADDAGTVAWAWERAAGLVGVSAAERGGPGAFNEAMMELGATVCTPRGAKCSECPLARLCIARKRGEVERIPRPKAAPRRKGEVYCCVVLQDGRGRVLLEQRPDTGLWAGMWHVPSRRVEDRDDGYNGDLPAGHELARALGLPRVALEYVGVVRRTLTHRRLELRVWRGRVLRGRVAGAARGTAARQWVEAALRPEFAVPNAYLAVIEAASGAGTGTLKK